MGFGTEGSRALARSIPSMPFLSKFMLKPLLSEGQPLAFLKHREKLSEKVVLVLARGDLFLSGLDTSVVGGHQISSCRKVAQGNHRNQGSALLGMQNQLRRTLQFSSQMLSLGMSWGHLSAVRSHGMLIAPENGSQPGSPSYYPEARGQRGEATFPS